MNNPTIMTTFRCDADTYGQLLIKSETEGRTVSDIIREALTTHLNPS